MTNNYFIHLLKTRLIIFLLCLLSQMRWVLLASKLPSINIIIINHNIINQGCTTCCLLSSGLREKGENEKMKRCSLSSFPHFLFISSLSIHLICHILSQNVKYGTFVANVTKKRAMRKKFWSEFAGRKLRKLCQPVINNINIELGCTLLLTSWNAPSEILIFPSALYAGFLVECQQFHRW